MLKYLKPLYSLTTKVLRAIIIWRRKAAALYMVNSFFYYYYFYPKYFYFCRKEKSISTAAFGAVFLKVFCFSNTLSQPII